MGRPSKRAWRSAEHGRVPETATCQRSPPFGKAWMVRRDAPALVNVDGFSYFCPAFGEWPCVMTADGGQSYNGPLNQVKMGRTSSRTGHRMTPSKATSTAACEHTKDACRRSPPGSGGREPLAALAPRARPAPHTPLTRWQHDARCRGGHGGPFGNARREP